MVPEGGFILGLQSGSPLWLHVYEMPPTINTLFLSSREVLYLASYIEQPWTGNLPHLGSVCVCVSVCEWESVSSNGWFGQRLVCPFKRFTVGLVWVSISFGSSCVSIAGKQE